MVIVGKTSFTTSELDCSDKSNKDVLKCKMTLSKAEREDTTRADYDCRVDPNVVVNWEG